MKVKNKILSFVILGILLISTQLAIASPRLTGTQKSFSIAFEALVKNDGASAEEWDIEMPCPTGRVKVVVSDQNIWNGDLLGNRYRVGREVAFGCYV